MLEPDPDLFRVRATVKRGHDTDCSPVLEPEPGQTGFPLFSEAPFITWCHQNRKLRRQGRIHPTCLPLIRLWDEVDDPEQKS